MTLKECIEIGKECGMTNLKECFNNIDFHTTQLFEYDKMISGLNELSREIEEKYNITHLDNEAFFEYIEKIKV